MNILPTIQHICKPLKNPTYNQRLHQGCFLTKAISDNDTFGINDEIPKTFSDRNTLSGDTFALLIDFIF